MAAATAEHVITFVLRVM